MEKSGAHMLDFIRRFFGSSEHSTESDEFIRAVDDGLDLRAAVAAHENWKIRLDAYLAGQSSEDLRPEVICFDDRCDLGKWIHSTGKARLGRLPGFTALLSDHKQFHYAASNVVALAKAGKKLDALKMLAGPYAHASKGVMGALTGMMQLVERQKAKA
jgi:Chemoreceptor zinc-binding domain